MVRSLFDIPIGHEALIPKARHEAERGNFVAQRVAHKFIGKKEAPERDWQWPGVVQLDEVVLKRCRAERQPFIDAQRARISKARFDIGGTEGWLRQCPRAVSKPPDGEVGKLETKSDRIDHRSTIGSGVIEINSVAALVTIEATEVARRAVRIVCEDNKVTTRRNAGAAREDKLIGVL